jgi:hypothetical protein
MMEFTTGITCSYRVSVQLPDELADALAENIALGAEFDKAMHIAFNGFIRAGSDLYSGHEEWAEFESMHAAERARNLATLVVGDFIRKVQA